MIIVTVRGEYYLDTRVVPIENRTNTLGPTIGVLTIADRGSRNVTESARAHCYTLS